MSHHSCLSRFSRLVLTVVAALALAGCESTGLSPREAVSGNSDLRPNYANYVYSLYDAADPAGDRAAHPVLSRPARWPWPRSAKSPRRRRCSINSARSPP